MGERFKVITKSGEINSSAENNEIRFKVIQKSQKAETAKNIRRILDPRQASANFLKDYKKTVDSLTLVPSVNYNEEFAKEYNAAKFSANTKVSQEALKRAKAAMNTARERYKSTQNYSLIERGINYIGGKPTESYDKAEARENYENAQSNYYNLITASLGGKTVQFNSKKSYKLNLSENDIEDIIYWLHNGKKERFTDGNGGLVRTNKSAAYYHIKDNEKNTLTHIYNSSGSKEAEEYLEYLMPKLNQRMTVKTAQSAVKFANENPILANVTAHITNLGKGFGVGEDLTNVLTGKPIDINSADHQASFFTNAIRQQSVENIIKETKDIPILKKINNLTSYIGIDNIPAFIYQAGVSTVDSAINFAFSKGLGGSTGATGTELDKLTSNISGVIMGSQVAQDSIIEAKQKGKSDSQAVSSGVISGLIEGITEKYSIDNILDNPNAILSKWIKNPAARAHISEGTEEWASNNLNRIADAFYYGDKSEIKKSYEQYISDGKSKDQALSLVIYDMFKEDTSSFLAGGLSGLAMYGTNAVWANLTGVNPTKIGKVVAENEAENEVIGVALSLNENTEAHKLAVKISKSGNMTVADIGKLAIAINQDASTQKNKIISDEVYNEVISLGGNEKDASVVGDYFVRAFNNQVSGSEALKMFKNDYVKNISEQLMQKEGGWYNKVREQLVSISNIKDRIFKITSLSNIKNSKLQLSVNDDILSNSDTLNEGDETNAGEQIRNSDRWARGENGNSESGPGAIQETDGGVSGGSQENGWQQTGREGLRNNQNNRGVTLAAEQTDSLKTSAIKNEDGIPKIVYHFTDDMNFTRFEKGDIGFHFGNENQATERGKILQKTGRIIKAYLDIKNPINISTDIMNWKPMPLAFKLKADGIITQEQYLQIEKMQTQSGSQYDSPAAVELRRILLEKGYDGIVYENMFEGDGESYIAFYPEQVIIIDDGKNQNSQSDFNAESGVQKGVTSILRKSRTRHHTTKAEQEKIIAIAKALGRTVVFENMYDHMLKEGKDPSKGIPDGYVDKATGVIHIGYTVSNPVAFILKHELTHFLEKNAEKYKIFANAVMDSSVFKDWLKSKGYNSVSEYNAAIVAQYSRHIEEFGETEANLEIVANFVADNLFGNSQQINEKLLKSLNENQRRTFFEVIRDFFAYLKEKLWGDKALLSEIEVLEQEFIEAYRAAEKTAQKNTAGSDEIKYSIINLDTGKSYVQAARQVIHGNSVAEWRSQISNFFNNSLKDGPIEIKTIEGDTLTISKETANKARSKTVTENGIVRELTNKEFLVKLNAEAHIDELAEISKKNKGRIVPDSKNHNFAKEGFTYRTVYFQDFDGTYYRVTLSVGENRGVSTVYNVGKIKTDDIPDGNIISTIGSKADMSSAKHSIYNYDKNVNVKFSIPATENTETLSQTENKTVAASGNPSIDSITDKQSTVNNNSMQQSPDYSVDSGKEYLFGKVLDPKLIALAEQREREGKTREEIWIELGVIRDAAGVWVDEIDDSNIKFVYESIFAYLQDPDYKELKALEEVEDWTEEQAERFAVLEGKVLEKYGYDDDYGYGMRLGDVLVHDKLFERYPQLAETKVIFTSSYPSSFGHYDAGKNAIYINGLLSSEMGEIYLYYTLIHEIQHAIQKIDGREQGSSIGFWEEREKTNGLPYNVLGIQAKSAEEAYSNTAGEIEAEESASRWFSRFNDKKRRQEAPDFGWDRAILANEITGRNKVNAKIGVQYSIPSDNEYMPTGEIDYLTTERERLNGGIPELQLSANDDILSNNQNSVQEGNDELYNERTVDDKIKEKFKNTNISRYNKNSPLSFENRAGENLRSSINWVYKAKIFSQVENKLFHQKISEINQDSDAFTKNSIGEYMLPIENKIVFTDGNYDSPYISEILEVLTDYSTDFEKVKERIFNVERGKSDKENAVQTIRQMFGEEFVLSYRSGVDGVYDWENGKRKGSTRGTVISNYLRKYDGERNDTESKETTIDDDILSNNQNSIQEVM